MREPIQTPAHAGVRAWLFPGQGSHAPEMVAGCRGVRIFDTHLALLDDLAGESVLTELERRGPSYLNRNEIVAGLTILVSATHLDRLRSEQDPPAAAAGYSVGQWTALFAAGMCPLDETLRIVWARSACMNQALAGQATGICGVVGLTVSAVEEICVDLARGGHRISLSNINAPGNVSVAGDLSALKAAEPRFQQAGAYRVVALPVSGAWHSPILREARDRFAGALERVQFRPPNLPVLDNVSGSVLPGDRLSLLRALADHLVAPVRWHDCVHTMLQMHVGRFTEVGFGDMLTRFGRFIDRKTLCEPYPGLSAPRSS